MADAGEWHINADEPTALEYGSEFKSAEQRQNYYAPDAYRSSDHDPLYVDLQLVPIAGADEVALGMLGLAGFLAWRRRR
ncbi:Uncharacterized protein conserved in bacteria [Chromobacterium violaceum]|uniref:Uncharacterized protein conserved in bacteria n=1 Tax=Chromobacterium violaceum TaxID=536 RepID=A0A447TJH9_CHRVL|nr:Uncharacterized protein conserved in bacteria [Chromobacterium violaceum]